MTPDLLPPRIAAKIAVDSSGCWLWTGAKADGYGRVGLSGRKRIAAHRLAYTLLVGPIPEGSQLDHLCRVRHCLNPAHLEPVDCRTNLLRGQTIAATNAAKERCVHGHLFDEANTRYRMRGNSRCRSCRTCERAQYTPVNRLAASR